MVSVGGWFVASRHYSRSAVWRLMQPLVKEGFARQVGVGRAIELTTHGWRRYWERLLQFDGLAFVCVGDEEGVELNDRNLSVSSFPWDEWPLLTAALRGGEAGMSSDWVIRERTGTS